MFQDFYSLITHFFGTIDYWAVFIMMAIEASLIPFPSEIPMLAVGVQSAAGTMYPLYGLIVALSGVWLGTTLNYLLGRYVGDACIEKYGKYLGISHEGYLKTRQLFQKDANFYTFFGRLIPVVRQLISIPAGMAKMPYGKFILLSLSGSALWLIILIVIGYFIGENTALIGRYIGWISLILGISIAGLFIKRHGRGLFRWIMGKLKQQRK